MVRNNPEVILSYLVVQEVGIALSQMVHLRLVVQVAPAVEVEPAGALAAEFHQSLVLDLFEQGVVALEVRGVEVGHIHTATHLINIFYGQVAVAIELVDDLGIHQVDVGQTQHTQVGTAGVVLGLVVGLHAGVLLPVALVGEVHAGEAFGGTPLGPCLAVVVGSSGLRLGGIVVEQGVELTHIDVAVLVALLVELVEQPVA